MDNNLYSICETVAEQPVLLKTCSKCHVAKEVAGFYQDKNRNGPRSFCKECAAKASKANRKKNKARAIIVIPDFKTCYDCHVEKPGLGFFKDDGRADGLEACCKECEVKKNRARWEKNKAREIVAIPESKTCPDCKKERSRSDFSKSNGNTDARQVYCKECKAVRHIKLKYNLSPEQFNAMLKTQGGACAICRTTTPGGRGTWHVDHIHGTDVIRGLLHSQCNTGLGFFKDNVGFINTAIEYLSGPTTGISYKKTWGKNGVPKAIKDKILNNQGWLCKICSVDLHNKKPHLDHCHLTGVIRGYLCHNCNCGLGQFDDSVELLTNAIGYLTCAP